MKKIIIILVILIISMNYVLSTTKIPIALVKIIDGDTIEAKINNNKENK